MKKHLVTSVALVSWLAAAACGRLGTGDDMELGDGDSVVGDGDGDTGTGDGDVGDGDVGDGDIGDGDVGDGDIGDGDVGDGDRGIGGFGGMPEREPPACQVTSPQDYAELPFYGERTEFGAATGIYFAASATDPEDGTLRGESISWFLNSWDNQVGEGQEMVLESLPPGENKIYCQATDSDGQTGFGYVHVISISPVVSIQQPGDIDGPYPPGEIEFSAVGFDYEDGELDGKDFFWESSIDGELGQGNGEYSLSPGEHQITVYALDSDHNDAEDATYIHVIGDIIIDPGPD